MQNSQIFRTSSFRNSSLVQKEKTHTSICAYHLHSRNQQDNKLLRFFFLTQIGAEESLGGRRMGYKCANSEIFKLSIIVLLCGLVLPNWFETQSLWYFKTFFNFLQMKCFLFWAQQCCYYRNEPTGKSRKTKPVWIAHEPNLHFDKKVLQQWL